MDRKKLNMMRLGRQHKSWAQNANKLLQSFIEESTPETWTLLETQDPEGILTQQRFRQFAKTFFERK